MSIRNVDQTILTARAIYDYIDRKVVGQEQAKKIIANATFLHIIRGLQDGITPGLDLKKANALLMGPSGTGKTLIVREAAKAVKHLTGIDYCPILEIDCTALSPKGWQGDHLADAIEKHYFACNDTKIFETSIVFLDEFDKICIPALGAGGTNHNRNTQYSLLKMVEGTIMQGDDKRVANLNTHRMLFVLAGNFESIRKLREDKDKTIGFTVSEKTNSELMDIHQELESVGMITELVGRTPFVGELQELTKDNLLDVLDEQLIPEFASTWEFVGRDLYIPESVKEEMVDKTIARKTGARGLQTDLTKYLEDELFDLELTI